MDSPAAFPDVVVEPMPKAIADLSGIRFSREINKVNYALFESGASVQQSELLRDLGAIALTQPYRRIEAGSAHGTWMRGVQSDDPASPENLGMLEANGDPVLVECKAGEGSLLYFASGLGEMYADLGHVDYAILLDVMAEAESPLLRTNAPSCVGVSLVRWSRGIAVHLVNGAGPAPLDMPAVVGPFELDLDWRREEAKVTLRTPDDGTQELEKRHRKDRIIISVPALGAYGLVVVEED
jgi:hypothetical protein